MIIKVRKAFSLLEVLLALTTLALIIVPLFGLEGKILLTSKRFHEKLIRLLPLANSLNNISLVKDLETGLEKKEQGPEGKIVIQTETIGENSPFSKFENLQKVIAKESWELGEESLVRFVFVAPKKDKEENKEKEKDKNEKTK